MSHRDLLPEADCTACALSRRGFPKKAGRTARIASDEEIQGTKDAVIQDLERKLRFKEDLLNHGQPVREARAGPGGLALRLGALYIVFCDLPEF